jgi:hypothetical protein
MMGDEVDVTIFPAPKWHEKDGGRYVGTGTYSICALGIRAARRRRLVWDM